VTYCSGAADFRLREFYDVWVLTIVYPRDGICGGGTVGSAGFVCIGDRSRFDQLAAIGLVAIPPETSTSRNALAQNRVPKYVNCWVILLETRAVPCGP